MEATVTIICGMILALGQGWLNLRLRQQDDARDAAREEAKQNAELLRLEAERVAKQVAQRVETVAADVAGKVDEATAQTDLQLGAIHVLVNTRLDSALTEIKVLRDELESLKKKKDHPQMIKVTVRGLDEFRANVDQAGDKFVEGVDHLMPELADETAQEARRRANRGRLTGASAGSIRAMGPEVNAGSGVPWYNFADFGGRVGIKKSVSRPFIKGGRWLFPAVRDVGVYRRADDMVDKATKELQ